MLEHRLAQGPMVGYILELLGVSADVYGISEEELDGIPVIYRSTDIARWSACAFMYWQRVYIILSTAYHNAYYIAYSAIII